jgi:hypothetical protein
MTKTQAKLQQMLAGTQKDVPATSTVDIDGQEMKQPDIVAQLQSWAQLHEQKEAAKAAASKAVQALTAIEPQVTKFMVAYGQALKQVLGKGSALLADFGLVVTQRKVPTTETRILAQAKAAATRRARKTMGSQQKKAVKGADVASVTVSPDADPAVVSVAPPPGSTAGAVTAAPAETAPVPIGGGGK